MNQNKQPKHLDAHTQTPSHSYGLAGLLKTVNGSIVDTVVNLSCVCETPYRFEWVTDRKNDGVYL